MESVIMPKMGDTMEEGRILRWLKQEGDEVKRGDALAEIETDKVNIEVEAFVSGVLRKILVPEGDSAPVGGEIALVGSADEPLPDAAASPAGTPATAAPRAEAPVAEVPPAAPEPPAAAPPGAGREGRVIASPVARKLAEEHDLDLSQIGGSGPGGRILREDVERYLEQPRPPAAAVPTAPGPPTAPREAVPAPPAPSVAPPATEPTEIELSRMRRTIATRMTASKQTVPHFYVTMDVDATELMRTRASLNDFAQASGDEVSYTVNDLLVKAVAQTLGRLPRINVSYVDGKLFQNHRVNIGIAVGMEDGLIVPVIHDVDRKPLRQVAQDARAVVERARSGRLTATDLSGGTFTVTNLGMYGVDSFSAIINPPESGILAVGAVTERPVVAAGQIVVSQRLSLTMAVDHRALDGVLAARFMQELKRTIEHPAAMLA